MKIHGLKFEEEGHRFSANGRPVPSVTQVLRDLGCYDPGKYTAGSAGRGTWVHKACHHQWKGILDWGEMPPDKLGYLSAFVLFLAENQNLVIADVEKMVSHSGAWFAGFADIIGILDDQPILIDIKSGGHEKWHWWQVEGYAFTVGSDVWKGLLYLGKDGKYTWKLEQPGYGGWLQLVGAYNVKHGRSRLRLRKDPRPKVTDKDLEKYPYLKRYLDSLTPEQLETAEKFRAALAAPSDLLKDDAWVPYTPSEEE